MVRRVIWGAGERLVWVGIVEIGGDFVDEVDDRDKDIRNLAFIWIGRCIFRIRAMML